MLDFMLLNSFFAWNTAAQTNTSGKYVVTKIEYYAVIAEEIIACVNQGQGYELVKGLDDSSHVGCLDHAPELMVKN